MKQNHFIYILIGAIVLLLLFSNAPKKEIGGSVTRTVSSTQVAPGGTFTLRYNVVSSTAPWYFIIRDTIASGGCTFVGTVDNKVLPTTIMSPTTNTVLYTVNAPSTTGTCTISGYSKQGTAANVNFPDVTVNICSPVNGVWSAWSACTSCSQTRACNNPAPSCGGTQCSGSTTQACGTTNCVWGNWGPWSNAALSCGTRTRTKTTVEACGGTCTGSDTETKSCTCPIVGDTPPACDGISVSELSALGQAWMAAGGPQGTMLDNLAAAGQDWMNHGGPL